MYRYVIKEFRTLDEVPKDAQFMSTVPLHQTISENPMPGDYVQTTATQYLQDVTHFFLVRERVPSVAKDDLSELDEEGIEVKD